MNVQALKFQTDDGLPPVRKGAPVPGKTGGGGARRTYGFDRLGVTDSMIVPVLPTEDARDVLRRVASAAYGWAKRSNAKVAVRLLPEGIGVWRIA